MTFGLRFGSVAEGLEDRFAIEPIRKLIGIVTAAGLSALAAGDQQDRIVPIGDIRNEAHRRAVTMICRARAEACAGLRPIGFAQEELQQTAAAYRMLHL